MRAVWIKKKVVRNKDDEVKYRYRLTFETVKIEIFRDTPMRDSISKSGSSREKSLCLHLGGIRGVEMKVAWRTLAVNVWTKKKKKKIEPFWKFDIGITIDIVISFYHCVCETKTVKRRISFPQDCLNDSESYLGWRVRVEQFQSKYDSNTSFFWSDSCKEKVQRRRSDWMRRLFFQDP